MNANLIIEDLLERIKNLTREVAYVKAQLQTYEQQQQERVVGDSNDN